ncbi:hypothetical protein ATANTOWER_020580 [Ataeniobius toweri]|uniref:Uncharacterized protein n=1 Tax=Ataeniobius toweri TaxID=208326 RepID=A0ABU7AJP2_9TELE|nr:hypothetical protein [Ataeniobius toweri]
MYDKWVPRSRRVCSHESKIWKRFINFFIGQTNILMLQTGAQSWKDTVRKPTEDKETTEKHTIVYILLRIMESKYVYQVAFTKPLVQYLHCVFSGEELSQTTVSLLADERAVP